MLVTLRFPYTDLRYLTTRALEQLSDSPSFGYQSYSNGSMPYFGAFANDSTFTTNNMFRFIPYLHEQRLGKGKHITTKGFGWREPTRLGYANGKGRYYMQFQFIDRAEDYLNKLEAKQAEVLADIVQGYFYLQGKLGGPKWGKSCHLFQCAESLGEQFLYSTSKKPARLEQRQHLAVGTPVMVIKQRGFRDLKWHKQEPMSLDFPARSCRILRYVFAKGKQRIPIFLVQIEEDAYEDVAMREFQHKVYRLLLEMTEEKETLFLMASALEQLLLHEGRTEDLNEAYIDGFFEKMLGTLTQFRRLGLPQFLFHPFLGDDSRWRNLDQQLSFLKKEELQYGFKGFRLMVEASHSKQQGDWEEFRRLLQELLTYNQIMPAIDIMKDTPRLWEQDAKGPEVLSMSKSRILELNTAWRLKQIKAETYQLERNRIQHALNQVLANLDLNIAP